MGLKKKKFRKFTLVTGTITALGDEGVYLSQGDVDKLAGKLDVVARKFLRKRGFASGVTVVQSP